MQIRRYRRTDRDDVWALHDLALKPTGAHPGSGRWDEGLHQIGKVYLDNGGEFLVGVHAGEIVAIGALKRSSNDSAEIKRMRVHPDFQRRGFGQAILEKLESRAADMGYVSLHLETTVQQTAAQALYLENGYVEGGRKLVSGFEVIVYSKALVGN